MTGVKRLIQEANPVRNDRVENVARAEARLAELLGGRAAAETTTPLRTPVRRRALVWGMAAAIAVVGASVAGVIVLRDPAPPSSSSDEPFFSTTADLEDRAEAIVRVTVVATRTVTRDGFTETAATAEVSRVAKGDPQPGSSIEVVYSSSGPEQAGGIRRGGEYVLLLQRRDATSWNLVNTVQGYYTVKQDALTPTTDNPVELSAGVRTSLGVS
ncbi:hypothetical protein [Actinoplanes regularis]|uniref:Uncharacterized protein n=1 Tax=Actinoplanes regularis TaxID=52697 RepID=A0A238W3R3_9ACTN|nr:hypothetical protein [Actinoplanes regularis]GIE85314.1 hypothetical protein Are01nite_17940 [Actinoplanes regularis]SNR40813.1 hypothetical protein SAMN06264365_102113 [Actinoplanes regularis]